LEIISRDILEEPTEFIEQTLEKLEENKIENKKLVLK
jgi:hypothetical protein